MLRDFAHNAVVKRVISPVSSSNDAPLVGEVIDILGAKSCTFLIATGSLADADMTAAVLLEESDAANMDGATPVVDADMISQTAGVAPEAAAGFQFDDDNEVRKLGYIGNKRYVRLTVTPSNNASAALVAAVALLEMESRPVVQAAA